MYKLLIVDDEKQVREGLKKMIPWNEYGIEICGEAQNGKEALELLKDLSPQIILLDIQMPEMDGLEVAKILYRDYPQCKFVVLSGFSDFALVRQAMKYGAVDYLLKPSGKDEIIQIIEEIIDNLEDEILSRLKNNEQMKLMRNNVLNRLIAGTISNHEMHEKFELLELDLKKGPFTVVLAEIVAEHTEVDVELEVSRVVELSCICDRIIDTAEKGVVFTDSAGRVCMIIREYGGLKKDIRLQTVLEECISTAKLELGLDIVISVGSSELSCRKLFESYRNAVHSTVYKGALGEGKVLYYDEIQEYFAKSPAALDIDGDKFKDVLKRGNFKEVYLEINNVLNVQVDQNLIELMHILKSRALEIVILTYQCMDDIAFMNHNRFLEEKNLLLREIMMQTTPESVKEKVLTMLEDVLERISDNQRENMSKPVFDTLQFIELHFDEPDLSLQFLADQYHTNTAYLGRLFKKEIGSSFADYLNMYRIKQAEKLLLSTNYKGVELAKKVGFSSYNYFYIVFKKVTGKRPMDIRKN